ncbi:LLM class F420-dependent oxidoreductase [Streptomyces profundus]|uniref:LLM class F420-dependent oxidoreductase n=1 Tax=Streptomyces profundus TaxID=2867410 RepID=UPI001D168533|nr:LLM class F420-dependent oxidoreductase [Streptomyces sp. MA3_2.13]UED85192.1 LLM class F420-dependent oxidoreductase [Streptomyces sp. MA3_2.13]
MTHTLATELGPVGVWSIALKSPDGSPQPAFLDAARELEQLGYRALWIGGSPTVRQAEPLLAATSTLRVATGITSIWGNEAQTEAADFAEVNDAHDNRFVLGLGVSHGPLTERYHRPYSSMVEYLTALDQAPRPVPRERRVLAALGPKMLELARDRAAGAHPYLVTVEHTAQARATLGDDALLAPELKVVLDDDLTRARATARGYLSGYLKLPNYTNNLLRAGFTDEDFVDGGSDRLLAEVFALGDQDTIRQRVADYLDAGADHLAVQIVTDRIGAEFPLAEYRALAPILPLSS